MIEVQTSVIKRSIVWTGMAFFAAALTLLLAVVSNAPTAAAGTMIYTPGTHSKGVPAGLVPVSTKAVETSYPATFGPILGDDISYTDSKTMGVKDATAKAAAVQGPVVLGGHSQGAVVAVDTAENLRKEGVKSDSDISYDVYSDGRLTGTGMEVVLEKYSPLLLPLTGGQLQGERTDMGDIKGESTCRRGDGICSMEDPLQNPGGAFCSVVGYGVEGYHGYSGNEPTRDVQRGNTLVHIIDAPNPCIPFAERAIGGPVTPEFADFIEAAAPISDPGSPQLSSPDLGEVITTGFNAAAAAMNSPVRAPELPNLSGGDQGIAAPLMEQVAPVIDNFVAQAPQQIKEFVEPIVEQYTTPAPSYTAPQTTYEAPVVPSFDAQQIASNVSAVVTQVAPDAAPMINDAVAQFANVFAGR